MKENYNEDCKGLKRAHRPLDVPDCHQECNSVQRHDNIYYIWSCNHMITNHAIYVHRGTTSTVYLIYKSRINEAARDKGQ